MPVIDTLRPTGIDAAGGWTAEPSGTLDEVTSDDNDATYALSSTNTAMRLTVPSHTPPAGHQRHLIRARARARSDTSTATVAFGPTRPGGGSPATARLAAGLTTTPTDFSTAWNAEPFYSLGSPGSVVYAFFAALSNPTNNVRIVEGFIDIDNRHKPTFTPAVLDGAGVDQAGGVVTDTNIVRTRFDDDDYDGLSARSWRVAIYTEAQTLEVGFEPFVTTPVSDAQGNGAPQVASHVLPNDDYVGFYQLFSNIRQGDPFASDIETASFEVAATPALAPANMTVTPLHDPPAFEVCWEAPADASLWTEPENVYVEVVRRDCHGTHSLALIPDAVEGCYVDRFAPLANQGTFCDAPDHECEVCYDIRYWGYRGLTVEPTETPIPEGVILAWPDTEASIPSNWSRVTALNGRYPKGVPDGVTNPGSTGGGQHGHTLSSHDHPVNHNHGGGANTGNSSLPGSSDTASFFPPPSPVNTAAHPHNHTRPTTSTAAATSGSNTPSVGQSDTEAPRKEVIFVESDGVDTTVPAGMLGIQHASSPAPGWQLEDSDGAGASSRPPYWKGTAGDGSLALVGAPAHDHTSAAHTHNGVTHGHTSAKTGTASHTVPSSSTPQITVARDTHRHPLTITNAATGGLSSSGSGSTGPGAGDIDTDPLFRLTSFIESVTGPQFIGLVGLWLGTLANIPLGWQLCDGSNGTPNFLGRYPRHKGQLSVNLTGGGASHNHGGVTHTHPMTQHNHSVSAGSADLSRDKTLHTTNVTDESTMTHSHSTGNTANALTASGSRTTGLTSSDAPEPEHTEVAFIMLTEADTEPTDTQLLIVSETATFCVDAQDNPNDGCDWLRGFVTGDICICPDRSFARTRPFGRFQPIAGGLPTITTGTPGGRDYTLEWLVESEDDLETCELILSQPLVHFTPADQRPLFMAPDPTEVEVIKVDAVRSIEASFFEVEPPPIPDPAEVIPEPAPPESP